MTQNEINYEKYLVKSYNLWTTYLHYSQAYLGRCYIALNRTGNIDPYTETTVEERAELEVAIAELCGALNKLYQPDIINYANFRNTWPHCHWHVIPRYKASRILDGQEFVDNNWGRNYAPYDKNFQVSDDLLLRIQKDLNNQLANT